MWAQGSRVDFFSIYLWKYWAETLSVFLLSDFRIFRRTFNEHWNVFQQREGGTLHDLVESDPVLSFPGVKKPWNVTPGTTRQLRGETQVDQQIVQIILIFEQ